MVPQARTRERLPHIPTSNFMEIMSAADAPTHDAPSSDASLLNRIAALSDKAALAELDARYGMTLYAIAYAVLLDPGAADAAVAAALRDAWRKAAAFDARTISAGRWLAQLTRHAARERTRRALGRGGMAARRPAGEAARRQGGQIRRLPRCFDLARKLLSRAGRALRRIVAPSPRTTAAPLGEYGMS